MQRKIAYLINHKQEQEEDQKVNISRVTFAGPVHNVLVVVRISTLQPPALSLRLNLKLTH